MHSLSPSTFFISRLGYSLLIFLPLSVLSCLLNVHYAVFLVLIYTTLHSLRRTYQKTKYNALCQSHIRKNEIKSFSFSSKEIYSRSHSAGFLKHDAYTFNQTHTSYYLVPLAKALYLYHQREFTHHVFFLFFVQSLATHLVAGF